MTGSCHELSIDFSIGHIHALVITRVHIDHVGRIPYLLAAGFEGPIICSEPSSHAGQSDLVGFVAGIPAPPHEILIVHGDHDAKQALKRCFQSLRGTDIIIPTE